jgi:hypothetical protein
MRKQRAVPKYPRPKPPSKVAVKRLLAVAHANDMTVSGIADPDGSVSSSAASDATVNEGWAQQETACQTLFVNVDATGNAVRSASRFTTYLTGTPWSEDFI